MSKTHASIGGGLCATDFCRTPMTSLTRTSKKSKAFMIVRAQRGNVHTSDPKVVRRDRPHTARFTQPRQQRKFDLFQMRGATSFQVRMQHVANTHMLAMEERLVHRPVLRVCAWCKPVAYTMAPHLRQGDSNRRRQNRHDGLRTVWSHVPPLPADVDLSRRW